MEHTIEPELLSKIPRGTCHRNRSVFIAELLFRFVIVLLVGLGLAMFFYLCLQLALGSSKPIEGRILQINVPQSTPPESLDGTESPATTIRSSMPPRTPTIEYVFTADGREIEGAWPITPEQIKLLPQGNSIRIRYHPRLMDLGHRPILPNDTFWGWVGILGLITLVTDAAIGTLCWFTFALPRRQWNLCRLGQPAVATVVRKEVWGLGVSTYVVHYRFEPTDPGLTVEIQASSKTRRREGEEKPGIEVLGHMRVPRRFWDSIDSGDQLTALYMPQNPENNMLYAPSTYGVVAPAYAVVKARDESRVER